jgi:uncharacterized protein YjiS (DUF1127 family)
MLRNSSVTAPTASVPSTEARQFGSFLALAATWWERRSSRQALAELDDRLLRDIGLSPSEAVAESAMAFWRPLVWLQRK